MQADDNRFKDSGAGPEGGRGAARSLFGTQLATGRVLE